MGSSHLSTYFPLSWIDVLGWWDDWVHPAKSEDANLANSLFQRQRVNNAKLPASKSPKPESSSKGKLSDERLTNRAKGRQSLLTLSTISFPLSKIEQLNFCGSPEDSVPWCMATIKIYSLLRTQYEFNLTQTSETSRYILLVSFCQGIEECHFIVSTPNHK